MESSSNLHFLVNRFEYIANWKAAVNFSYLNNYDNYNINLIQNLN
jgi:hypothetical protein